MGQGDGGLQRAGGCALLPGGCVSLMRCPVCRAPLEQGPQCRRCRADLSLLFTLQEHRRGLLRKAYQAVAAAAWDDLALLAERVHSLRQDAESERLLALVHLLRRDFPAAWRAYQGRNQTG